MGLQACFGGAALNEVYHERISYAGITMGPWIEMISYLGIMNNIIEGWIVCVQCCISNSHTVFLQRPST